LLFSIFSVQRCRHSQVQRQTNCNSWSRSLRIGSSLSICRRSLSQFTVLLHIWISWRNQGMTANNLRKCINTGWFGRTRFATVSDNRERRCIWQV
jgi:hypothetical protein